MLDFFYDLNGPMQGLFISTVISAMVGAVWIAAGAAPRYTWNYYFWVAVPWDAFELTMLIAGGTPTWQHYLIGILDAIGLLISGPYQAIRGKQTTFGSEEQPWAVFFLVLLTLFTLWLVVAGSR